ncbi:hypothetical protein DFQ14_10827 [Halopolyspora algeriensis]|uniref:Uncharacterized protein n=1 Tax=Halopolyspora algeriensis TaxID=1500506 RepID=A0A368VM37_9ACTN|nr:hypothetical protein [Halopolyspora algeriensis]RCW42771.1 hypothetical protein DFQ14_10827 [Halopolyspora algeriensis]TQM56759.1 hypothetical protein FHU43_1573 [Halopolyspora algeriensis]
MPDEVRLDRVVLGALLLDAVLLAMLELLFLPSYLGGVPFPITAAVAAVTTPLLVSEAGRLSPRRGVAAAPLIVWFGTVFVFGLFGPGGDVLLLAGDWRTYLFLAGGALPGALMLGIVQARQGAGASGRRDTG